MDEWTQTVHSYYREDTPSTKAAISGNHCSVVRVKIWASPVAEWWRIHLWSRRCRFNLWVKKTPWRKKWQCTSVFLTEKSHGKRNLAGYSSWGRKESAKTEQIFSLIHYKSHCTEEKMEDQMPYDFFSSSQLVEEPITAILTLFQQNHLNYLYTKPCVKF